MYRRIIGIGSLVLPIFIFLLLIRLWPLGNDAAGAPETWNGWLKSDRIDNLPFEARMFAIVLLSGALGSLVQTMSSFARHLGVGDFSDSWYWWYVLRIPVGMALAIIMYFALRGGFFAPTTSGAVTAKEIINPFGFAAISALAGMFSKQAVDKLKELFDAIFKVTERPRKTVPHITSISPGTVGIGLEGVTLTLIGSGFKEDTLAMVNGRARDVKYLNDSAMGITLLAEDVAKKAEITVFALNKGKLGGTSESYSVSVK